MSVSSNEIPLWNFSKLLWLGSYVLLGKQGKLCIMFILIWWLFCQVFSLSYTVDLRIHKQNQKSPLPHSQFLAPSPQINELSVNSWNPHFMEQDPGSLSGEIFTTGGTASWCGCRKSQWCSCESSRFKHQTSQWTHRKELTAKYAPK